MYFIRHYPNLRAFRHSPIMNEYAGDVFLYSAHFNSKQHFSERQQTSYGNTAGESQLRITFTSMIDV
jgi:hypothetical protein